MGNWDAISRRRAMGASRGNDRRLPWQLTLVGEVTAPGTQEPNVTLLHPQGVCVWWVWVCGVGGHPASTHTSAPDLRNARVLLNNFPSSEAAFVYVRPHCPLIYLVQSCTQSIITLGRFCTYKFLTLKGILLTLL